MTGDVAVVNGPLILLRCLLAGLVVAVVGIVVTGDWLWLLALMPGASIAGLLITAAIAAVRGRS